MKPPIALRTSARHQTGLSVVEMLVGIAVGLIVVAAATLMVAGQLADNRRLLLETQVQQDLRAASDLIVRELRSAGYWGNAHRATVAGTLAGAARINPYRKVEPEENGAVTTELTFTRASPPPAIDNDLADANEAMGFRLDGTELKSLIGGAWQPLTDKGTLRITGFRVTPRVQEVQLDCPLACSPGATPCPPVQQQRRYLVEIEGEAAHDPRVKRAVQTEIRVRNDAVVGECRD